MSGLTANGFEVKRQSEILEDIETDQKAVFGDDLILDSSSPDGQFNGLISDQMATLWQLGLSIYSGLDPRTASGLMLDRISAIAGIQRLQASPSTANVSLTGSIGAIIPANTKFSAESIPNVKFTLDSEIVLDSSGNGSGGVTADTLGAIIVASNTITKIDTPVSGLLTVNNTASGATGVDEETDEELRRRRANSLSLGSISMVESIESNVGQIDGVDRTKLYENLDTVVDENGLAPHSIEVFARGGADASVAEAIALKRSAGCGLAGTTSSPWTDNNGFVHDIKFSRPSQIPIFVEVTATKLPNWDINANDNIATAIANYGNGTEESACDGFLGYEIAQDVYGGELIFSLGGVSGISIKQILVGRTSPGTSQVEAIEFNELAIFDTANISVNYV